MADLIEVREKRLRQRDVDLNFTGPSDSSVATRGGRGPRPPRAFPPGAPVPPRSESSPEGDNSVSLSEPELPTIVVRGEAPTTAFLGPTINATPFTFVPTVEVTAKRVVKTVAKRSLQAALLRVARLLVANPIVAGTIALLFPTKLNDPEKEFLEAYYGTSNAGRLPDADAVSEIEVREPRLRPRVVVPKTRAPVVLPARPPSRVPRFTPASPFEDAPDAEPEARPPAAPPRRPTQPADPFAFDPDEDDIWLIPRVTPKPLPRIRVPGWIFDPTEIGPEGPTPLPLAPRPRTRPRVRPLPLAPPTAVPGPVGDPLPSVVVDPIFQPVPTTSPSNPVRVPIGDAVSAPFPLPLSGFLPTPSLRPGRKPKPGPRPDTAPAPPPIGADPCNCAAQKKKKPKERKNRDVCYRGTYVEKSRGLIKHRKEEVPCR